MFFGSRASDKGLKQAENRLEKLKSKYFKFRDNELTTGTGAIDTPEFYDELEKLLGKKQPFNFYRIIINTSFLFERLGERPNVRPSFLCSLMKDGSRVAFGCPNKELKKDGRRKKKEFIDFGNDSQDTMPLSDVISEEENTDFNRDHSEDEKTPAENERRR